MAIRHTFSSPKADGADATLVKPSDWNASHDDGGLQANIDTVSNAVSVVSQALSVLSQATSVADAALSARIDTVSASGGGGTDSQVEEAIMATHIWDQVFAGTNVTFTETSDESGALTINATAASVTSAELAVEIADRISADNLLSQAHSVLSQAVSVADAALSVRVDAVSQAHSALSQAVSVLSNAASNALSVANAASNAASIVSQALSVETANRISADTLISNAASNALSVANAASNAVSNEISNRVSADNLLSQAISVVSAFAAESDLIDGSQTGQPWDWLMAGTNITFTELADGHALQIDATAGSGSVTSTELSAVSAQAASAINVVSNAVSALTVAHDALSNTVSNALSAGDTLSNALSALSVLATYVDGDQTANIWDEILAGTNITFTESSDESGSLIINATGNGSVTSAELGVEIADRVSADNALSQAASVAQAALSVRIDAVSQAHSVLSQAVSVLSNATSNALSVANAASNAASIVSQALSAETVDRISVDNILLSSFSLIAQAVSVLSQMVSAADVSILAQAELEDASGAGQPWDWLLAGTNITFTELADGHALQIDATAGSGSVTSAELAVEIADRISADNLLSQAHSVLSQAVSVLSQATSVADAALSVRIDAVSQAHSALSQAVSVLSNAASNALSVANAASNAVSNEISNRVSADGELSLRVDSAVAAGGGAATDMVMVDGTEAAQPWETLVAGTNVTLTELADGHAVQVDFAGPTTTIVQGNQGISATALANVSGLSASVVAGGLYRMDAMLMVDRAAAGAVTKLGLTFPAMTQARGYIRYTMSAVQGLPATTTEVVSSQGHFVPFNGDSASGSIIVSSISAPTILTNLAVYQGLFFVSTTGAIHLQAGASTSAGTGITIIAGSYMQVFRIG